MSEKECGIRAFIKDNYREMYLHWAEISDEGFYGDATSREG